MKNNINKYTHRYTHMKIYIQYKKLLNNIIESTIPFIRKRNE